MVLAKGTFPADAADCAELMNQGQIILSRSIRVNPHNPPHPLGMSLTPASNLFSSRDFATGDQM